MIRLFVALALPDAVAEGLAVLQAGVPGARWSTRDQLHLTLRFIGEVDGRDAAAIDDTLAAIEAPRTFWAPESGLMVESPYGADVMNELRRRGHRVSDIGVWNSITGGMEMIRLNASGVREAAADPRREGYALAY